MDFQRFERHWQQEWQRTGAHRVDTAAPRPLLVAPMFPYPSGKLHVGHVRNYTITDVQARFWRRRGYDVLHPMGWDAFGLPAENTAIREGIHPLVTTRESIAVMKSQLQELGMSYDWAREIATCDPAYYRWTQWLFVQLFRAGLAYRAAAPANWCPACQTTLANEQCIGRPLPGEPPADPQAPLGRCERCGTPIQERTLAQWFFRITRYADELLAGLDRLPDWPEHVRRQQGHWIGRQVQPDGSITYHLRDWLVSRQRYWGAPIPIVHCGACGPVPVPEEQLPVLLPEQVDYTPAGGVAPLATVPQFVRTACPRCGRPARRETETMDTFVDSSWYLYRYLSPDDETRPFDPEAAARWLPVRIYVGGAEHAILHLMYVRFIAKALRDLGWLPVDEPVQRLFALGMVYLNGAKMSKSRGNCITQDEVVARYGADTLRLYAMFQAPADQHVEWQTGGIAGCHRFLRRLFAAAAAAQPGAPSPAAHRLVAEVTPMIAGFRYNTAIARLMAFAAGLGARPAAGDVAAVVHLISPFAPHAAEELWHTCPALRTAWPLPEPAAASIHRTPWPMPDPAHAALGSAAVVVTVAGKKRGVLELAPDASAAAAQAAVAANPALAAAVSGHQFARYVPGRVISYV